MRYTSIVQAYNDYLKGKTYVGNGNFAIIHDMIDLTTERLGTRPALDQLVGALLLAQYEVRDAPMVDFHYETSYLSGIFK